MDYAASRQMFFCSHTDYGDKFQVRAYNSLTPRHKKWGPPIFRGAPSVSQCLALQRFSYRDLHVYRTLGSMRGFDPMDTSHVHITGERLLGPATRLLRVITLPAETVTRAIWDSEQYFRLTGLGYTCEMRAAIISHAFSVLPSITSNSWWREVVEAHARVLLDKANPSEWLVRQRCNAEAYSADISRSLTRHS